MSDAGYPIIVDIRDRLIAIIGGGNVALRKVQGLIDSGAKQIRVVSPEFHSRMPTSGIERIAERYRPEHLAGASLVFAATDSTQVNDSVVADARKIGALTCRADVEEAADFVTPAILRQGALLVTVSSGGSPALSAMIRDKLAAAIDPRWIKMAAAMLELRPIIRRSLQMPRRKEALIELCSDEAMDVVDQNGVAGLKQWLSKRYSEISST